ncbi:hypothetical protein CfE428DRAFT_4054 [Chthoniobacter flavus Ellin428]|uniref:DUF2231 domain-containing protein n=1 Tax=Chthoniobacter flavus Ellin428 TaxID=497964 RepID=B4D565_9BACT|nr:DUF2231 domain-containing protein [Chthoniobacter flavus]EDY18270.1 hypothetical protein CfE428DRAFT_4054 [Chthoniobacter flavus Ellin428]TCO91299.1 putative membrane protein [Chthoniobacter flavus]
MIEPSIWSNLHGASTHFPIALMLVSAFCDCASLLFSQAEQKQRALRSAGTITLVLGALGSYAAVFTGLVMTRWQVWGHATLLRHHQFVWPAFALMVGLATWRLVARRNPGDKLPRAYVVLMLLAAAFMSGAGYWGGEMLNRG